MDLEEKTLDKIGDRCEECGTKLTPAELQAAMESGGPALCSVHADEVVPLDRGRRVRDEPEPRPGPEAAAAAAHRQDDLAELAAGGEAVVGVGRLLEGIGRGDRDGERAG